MQLWILRTVQLEEYLVRHTIGASHDQLLTNAESNTRAQKPYR